MVYTLPQLDSPPSSTMANQFTANPELVQQENAATLQDFTFLLETGQYSDLTIVTPGKEFRAHKLILSARSKVFAAMFDHDCQESLQNRIVIPDIKGEVFEQLLRYIYGGHIPMMDHSSAFELLMAADKYGFLSLKSICEHAILSSISVETALTTLVFDTLRTKCKKFITNHESELIKTDNWKLFIKERPDLIAELYEDLVAKMVNLKNELHQAKKERFEFKPDKQSLQNILNRFMESSQSDF